jgi:polyhydroxyalkanoate synthesis repressor PhaR
MVTIKKYSNRRLYDTSTSSYVTLEELADKIRSGTDVQVIDVEVEEDITQEVLAQIILESRGAAQLLPVPLLMRLIRMGDDRLAEFFGQFMSWSLEMYLRFKEGAETMTPYNPFGGAHDDNMGGMLTGPEAFFRMFMNQVPWSGSPPWEQGGEPSKPPADPPPKAAPESGEQLERPARRFDGEEPDVDELRDEIDELKNLVRSMHDEESDSAGDSD